MWDRATHKDLLRNVPLKIEIDWEKRPSAEKYGCVNALLSVLEAFSGRSGTFYSAKEVKFQRYKSTPLNGNLPIRKKETSLLLGTIRDIRYVFRKFMICCSKYMRISIFSLRPVQRIASIILPHL